MADAGAGVLLQLGTLAGGSLILALGVGVGLRLLRRDGRTAAGKALTLVGTLSLGPGKTVHLVNVLGGLYLLGAAERSLVLLGRVPEEHAAAYLRAEMERGRGASRRRRPDFRVELSRALGKDGDHAG